MQSVSQIQMFHKLEYFRQLSSLQKSTLVYHIKTEGHSLSLTAAYKADMLSVKSQFLSSSWNTLALTRSALSEMNCEVQVCSVLFCMGPISLPSTLSDHIWMPEPSVDTAAWDLHCKIHMGPCHLFSALIS